MNYDTDGAGSLDFVWTGSPGDVVIRDSFTVNVTSNAPYTLGAAYENRFYNATNDWVWSDEPILRIKDDGSTVLKDMTNVTASYQSWYSYTSTVPVLDQITSHGMYLDFEGLLPLLTYEGVTIYIRASV